MRITDLHVANFKAIDQVSLVGLTDVVVIAGPNGSGKSTIFDAIKFWKSNIGAYQRDELRQWLAELGMSEQKDSLLYAHQRKDEPFSIRAKITLTSNEKCYLRDNARTILAFYLYKLQAAPGMHSLPILSMQNLDLIDEFRAKKEGILAQVQQLLPSVTSEAALENLEGSVEVSTSGAISVSAPLPLRLVLSVFLPQEIGFIDYYGPQRRFGRENVQSLNLQVDQQLNHQRQSSALYNHNNKYSTVKSELASAYVKRLISERAGLQSDTSNGLEQSVIELFNQFIPGKSFEGIVPTKEGSLSFNVLTSVGPHDLNDLSSGEKELIYGYLRLQNSDLRSSVILIDEPELHLNPRLTDGLPDFYYRHLGRPMDNQLWLVTHSDTILRQSVGYEGFKVYHLQTVGTYGEGEPQIVEVTAADELNRAVIDLVGDLAGYKPGGKLVILEGGGETEFDLHVIERLFPEFVQRVNLVSSESRGRVRALHDILDRLGNERGLFSGVYSIVDQDGEPPNEQGHLGRFYWPSYHIENYLLNPHFIREVLHENFLAQEDDSLDELTEKLRAAAASTKPLLIRHRVESSVRRALLSKIKVNTGREDSFTVAAIESRVGESIAALVELAATGLSVQALEQMVDEYSTILDEALGSDRWLYTFRGRDVLRSFVRREFSGRLSYESLRNQIIARMRNAQYQPIEMGRVLATIASAQSARPRVDSR